MYIFEKHPKKEESIWLERSLRIGDYFDVLLHNKLQPNREAVQKLRKFGIDLQDHLTYILVQFDNGVQWTADLLLQDEPNPLIQMIHAIFNVFRMHLFTSDGCLYALLLFTPPFQGEWFFWQMSNCCRRLLMAYPQMRVLISKDELGCQGIFHSANSLCHGLNYLRFFQESSQISFLDLKQQTALGSNESVSDYRRLSATLGEQLGSPDFQAMQFAREIVQALRNHAAFSIESLHRQMQSFSLIMLNYLTEEAVIDDGFLRKEQISGQIMDGDNETAYVDNLTKILTQLHDRRRELNQAFNTRRLRTVRAYIEQNISDMDLSVSRIAEDVGVNRSQLTAQFRAYYGLSLLEFIQSKRLERACLLIESHPSRRLEQISREAGYYTLSTMYRAFQKKGLGTPAQYRERRCSQVSQKTIHGTAQAKSNFLSDPSS